VIANEQQSGMAVIAVLGVLLASSALTLAGLERSLLGERLSVNYTHQLIATEAAEAALRLAQAQMLDQAQEWIPRPVGFSARQWRGWLAQNGVALRSLRDRHNLLQAPRIHIERLRPANTTSCGAGTRCGHRLTALAYGRSKQTWVVIQVVLIDADESRLWRKLR